jgi:hypothetical protein
MISIHVSIRTVLFMTKQNPYSLAGKCWPSNNRVPSFSNIKPIGASPRHDYVLTRYHKYARVGTYVPHTNTRMNCCVHACTATNTANLSKPTACMNHSIASTLPRTWQDINNSSDPTAASNWQLSSIKGIIQSQDHRPPPFQASRRLFIE